MTDVYSLFTIQQDIVNITWDLPPNAQSFFPVCQQNMSRLLLLSAALADICSTSGDCKIALGHNYGAGEFCLQEKAILMLARKTLEWKMLTGKILEGNITVFRQFIGSQHVLDMLVLLLHVTVKKICELKRI